MSWKDRAACRDVDPAAEGFDSFRIDKVHAAAALNAIKICRTCPVDAECLTEAREHKDFMVRGGRMLLEPWTKVGQKELDEDQLRTIVTTGTLNPRGAGAA